MKFKTACIFVDGENLRHSLCDLFCTDFDPTDYLPKKASWSDFFDDLVGRVDAEFRLRTYWYVVDEIDFWPYNLPKLRRDPRQLEAILRKDRYWAGKFDAEPDLVKRAALVQSAAIELQQRERSMKSRFDGWQQVQNGIAHHVDSVEFRRAGSIRYDLFKRRLGDEKGVDVKLATDLLSLNDIYDVGIVVSGDGDYVPAVQTVKDWGKHIVNVSFLKKSGGVLPGGARRLNQITDRVIEVDFADMQKFMNVLPAVKAVALAAPLPGHP
jgi:uncharacterized LabA/DUF88 family protein